MGREIWEPEVAAFREVRGYAPTGIDVMTGSFDVRNKGYAITIFTHASNPIEGLTLEQLDAVYGIERRRGHGAVATWGDLGLTGEWADKPVRLYGLPIARGFADYVQERVFQGSQLWKPELREFRDEPNSVSTATDGATRMLAALADDPYGIGYAGLVYSHPGTRAIPVAERKGAPFVTPGRATVRDRSYPLHRIISFFVDKAPGRRAAPQVDAFLRFVLSREGQAIIERDGGGYLPLTGAFANAELKKLEP
jgi:phosphate transport system substrate-binding protein